MVVSESRSTGSLVGVGVEKSQDQRTKTFCSSAAEQAQLLRRSFASKLHVDPVNLPAVSRRTSSNQPMKVHVYYIILERSPRKP